MNLFSLPDTTVVNKLIPKNAFDSFISSKQKKLFTELISRIIWSNKILTETTNLKANEVKEIQVFNIELKVKQDIQPIIEIIDRSISYSIFFIVIYEKWFYLSTSLKHPNPKNENNAVIDWTFKTEWISITENEYTVKLKESLDFVSHDLCLQISKSTSHSGIEMTELINKEKDLQKLEREAARLKSLISNCKQFNQKVELNIKLGNVQKLISEIKDESL